MRPLTLVLTLLLITTFGVQARNLELADYLNWEQVADPQLSPDGRRIIYTRQRVNKVADRMDSEVWQMTASGERGRFLLKGGFARWSPSGDRIAFIGAGDGRPQIFVRWMDDEGAVTQITHDVMQPNQIAWSPDGKWIAFRAQVPMTPGFTIALPPRPPGATWTADPPVFERVHYRVDRVGLKTGFDHLFVVPASGGTPRQLTEGNWDVGRRFSGLDVEPLGAFSWSQDSKSLVFSGEMDPENETNGWSSGIHRVDVATKAVTTLNGDPGSWGAPVVSPDGRSIAFIGSHPTDRTWPISELRVMDADGGKIRVLLDELTVPFLSVAWADNNRGLYLSRGLAGESNVHYVSLDGQQRQVTEGAQRLGLSSINGNTALAVYAAAHTTPNVASINLRSGAVSQLTDVNEDILSEVTLGDVEEIWYDSTDNTRVQGWIIKPPGFDSTKEYPLILEIHGGPNAMYDVGFDFRFQEFVSHDYVVLYTNPRGSTGYGVEFTHAIDNAYPGQADFDDLMAGVDAVLERGYVDKDRLFVTGCSGGGALTAWVVGHTDRFAAAASLCPVTDWIGMAGTADVAGWANKQFREPYWENPAPWLEHSPLMHVGKVSTPTLLITGDKDLRTPIAQAEAFYAALKMRGVPTALIPMKNEWHGTWTIPSNMLRTQLYVRGWFERHDKKAGGETAQDP